MPLTRKARRQIGGKEAPTYTTWKHMRQRVLNPRNDRYAVYGGRGIRICPHWSSFDWFVRDERLAGPSIG